MSRTTYNPYIDKYMHMVESGEINSCKEQKLLMKFLRKKLAEPNICIDHEAIEKSIIIPAKYFPFGLYDWQKFINAFIYGLRYNNGQLVFDRYFIMMGRGGGKNGYISYNCFYMLSNHMGIKNYNIDLIATTEDVAKRSFKDVYVVLKDNEKALKKIFSVTKEIIVHNKSHSAMEFNTANFKTKDSKRPGVIIFDEIHAYENYQNITVHTSGLGKVKDPRVFYLTTDGYVRNSVIDDIKQEALMVLNGELPRSTLFPFVCKIDKENEVNDIDLWEKANPSIRYNATLKQEMIKAYDEMQLKPAMRMEFMTKRMNFPIENALKAVASEEDIRATNQPMPDDLENQEAIGGLDYAQVRDFCTVGALFKKEGKRYWKQHSFMHHTAPNVQGINMEIINLAVEKGLLTIVYDESITAEHCVNWFLSQGKHFSFRKICMDGYRASIMEPKFKEAGFDVQIVRRGPATHAMLSPLVDEMFINHTIVFGDDPLMRWYCFNVYKDEKGNGNIEYKKYDKEKRKTDGFYAFLHALNADSEISDDYELDSSLFEAFVY